jgi:hypothetical protein
VFYRHFPAAAAKSMNNVAARRPDRFGGIWQTAYPSPDSIAGPAGKRQHIF